MKIIIEFIKSIADNVVLWSSLIINIYFCVDMIQKKCGRRKLKAILPVKDREVCVLTSEQRDARNDIMITFEQAYVLSVFAKLYKMAGKEIEIKSLSSYMEKIQLSSEVCIGGPLDNILTDRYIDMYFSKFKTFVQEEKLSQYTFEHKTVTNSEKQGFIIPEISFLIEDADTDYFVLIKLNENDLKEKKTVIILFGYTRKGLMCGIKFLYNNYKKIYRKYKEKHFFLIGKCSKQALQVNNGEISDLTKIMFEGGQDIEKFR